MTERTEISEKGMNELVRIFLSVYPTIDEALLYLNSISFAFEKKLLERIIITLKKAYEENKAEEIEVEYKVMLSKRRREREDE